MFDIFINYNIGTIKSTRLIHFIQNIANNDIFFNTYFAINL